jgi:hypothetical protein
MTLPTERSMPPEMMTRVAPIEIMDRTDICLRILIRFATSKNFGVVIGQKDRVGFQEAPVHEKPT